MASAAGTNPSSTALPFIIGIPATLMKSVFLPNVTTKKKGLAFGLGLGLTIVERIVKEHDGVITVEESKSLETELDVVEGIEKISGRRLERRHHPMRGGDVRRTWADNRKIRKQLGYKPVVGFDEGLRRTIAWYRENLL